MGDSYKVSDKLYINIETGEKFHVFIEALNDTSVGEQYLTMIFRQAPTCIEFRNYSAFYDYSLENTYRKINDIIPADDRVKKIDLVDPEETDHFSENSEMDESGSVYLTLVESVKADDSKLDELIKERLVDAAITTKSKACTAALHTKESAIPKNKADDMYSFGIEKDKK